MAQYYSENQDSPLRISSIKATLLGKEYDLFTSGGVFSKRKIDKGTELLVNKAFVRKGWEILDMGCGYGAVGIAVAEAYGALVTMVDVNKRAVMLAKKNAKLNNVDVKVLRSDIFEKVQGKFDTILVNPPQRAGKSVCFSIIDNSPSFLKEGGILQLVARHQKGGRHLSERMFEVFGNLETIAKGSGFRIYASRNHAAMK